MEIFIVMFKIAEHLKEIETYTAFQVENLQTD